MLAFQVELDRIHDVCSTARHYFLVADSGLIELSKREVHERVSVVDQKIEQKAILGVFSSYRATECNGRSRSHRPSIGDGARQEAIAGAICLPFAESIIIRHLPVMWLCLKRTGGGLGSIWDMSYPLFTWFLRAWTRFGSSRPTRRQPIYNMTRIDLD